MKDHIIELLTSGLKVTRRRGFIVIESGTGETRVPIDDVFGVLVLSEDILISTNVITGLIERDVPIVFCDNKYLPAGSLLNYQGHHLTQKRQAAQISLSEIQKGRLWQRIVQSKISNQGKVLQKVNLDASKVLKFQAEVEIHDHGNSEAMAARQYWRTLFGEDFRRDPGGDVVNSFLNYGYTILRSAVARSATACGLNPAIGIHHDNFENPFCLVDDLMEPFRPLVDSYVFEIQTQTVLGPSQKKHLASILEHGVFFQGAQRALSSAIQVYCQSFTNSVLASDYKLFNCSIDFQFHAV